jgi:hypothetical protein
MDGLFALSDLRVLFAKDSVATQFRKLEALVASRELIKVKKGLYARPDADLRRISQRIDPYSILSLGVVLAEEGLIGTVPGRRIWAVQTGKPRRYSCELGVIEFLRMAPELLIGWEWKDGLRRALPEKAYLDAWYYQYKGRSLPFDLLEDVDVDRLDTDRLSTFLQVYETRFQSYYKKWQKEAA